MAVVLAFGPGMILITVAFLGIAFMLLSEFALVCLIVNVLVLQQRARLLMPADHPLAPSENPHQE